MFVRTKALNGASIAILLFALLSAAVALFGSHDAKILLYKDSFVTGIIGLIFLSSLLFPKPLCYWFGQRFATGGTPEGIAWWSELWDKYSAFRRTQRVITVVWDSSSLSRRQSASLWSMLPRLIMRTQSVKSCHSRLPL